MPVATPNVSIPKPKPSAIPSPIPNAEVAPPEAPEVDHFALAEAAPPVEQTTTVPASANPAASAGPPSGDPFAAAEATAGLSGDLPNPTPIDEASEGGVPLSTRLLAKVGRSPEEQRRLLERSLGSEYETRVEDGDVVFRKKGDASFKRLDPKFFRSLSEFGRDLADAIPSVGIDAVTAVVGEALGISAGATAGAALGGLPGGVAGGFAGMAAGAAAGGVASSAIKEGIVRASGVEPDVSFAKDAAFNALLNVGTLGLGGLVKGAVGKVGEALAERPIARVKELAKIRGGIDEIQSAVGYAPKPNAALGTQIKSATDQLAESLGERVGAVSDKAATLAGKSRFRTEKFQNRLREMLTEEGVEITPNGIASIPKGLEASKPFGAPEGMSALKQLTDDYNNLVRNNGTMDFRQLKNTLSFYEKPAGFEKELPSSVEGAYRVLRGTLREERDRILPAVLEGTPEGEFAKSAYADFSSKIDSIRDLQKLALKKDSPEKFAEALIQPKDSAGVKQLKFVFGPESPQFGAVRSSWFAGIVDKAVDKETGIVSGALLKREMGRYGDDVLGELLTKEQQNALTALASNAEKVSYAGLVKNPENKHFIQRATFAFLRGHDANPSSYVHAVWSLFSNNKAAMDYMTNEGMLNLAKSLPRADQKSAAVQAANWLGKMTSASKVVKTKSGAQRYELPLRMNTVSAMINAHSKHNDESTQDFLQRKQDALEELHSAEK
ncbi:MAG TPA: hypothetical protein VMZ26_13370 [Pyrinomonadaceae bacterium]|nr:hypothetical protein [Pyrinomonadaceae bacterium]